MNDSTKKTRSRALPVKRRKGEAVSSISEAATDSLASDKGETVAAAVIDEYSVVSEKSVDAKALRLELNTLPVAIIPDLTGPGLGEGDKLAVRLTEMSNEVAWLLVGAGVAGIILPGVLGTPFFVVGVLVLLPGRAARIERWRQKYSSSSGMNLALKQINRFLDDIDKKYPRRIR